MPSQRRVRMLIYVLLAGAVTIFFFTSRLSRPDDPRTIQDFYHKTVNAMDRQQQTGGGTKGGGGAAGMQQKVIAHHDHDADGDIDADDEMVARQMAERLRQAEQKAKDNANAKAPNKPDPPSEVVGVGSSADGQKKNKGLQGDEEEEHETEEEHAVELELNSILKKSPVIIFSKSYCPFSKKAKGILLEKYVIDPLPFVVELDEHDMGPSIQDLLLQKTGRRTVPNIMVNGISIGGGDDIAALDRDHALADKIKELGGKRVDITERFIEDARRAI